MSSETPEVSDLIYERTNTEEIREESRRAAEWAREIEDADLNWLMADKRGRRIVARLMERTGQWRSTYASTDRDTVFLAAQRDVTTPLYAWVLTKCPDRFTQMIKEWQAHVRSRTDERQRNRER